MARAHRLFHLAGPHGADDWLYRVTRRQVHPANRDTDQTRYVPDSLQDIMDSLRWSGAGVDEGPTSRPYGRTSSRSRLELYRIDGLVVENANAYRCYCRARLKALRKEQVARGET